MQHIFLFLEQHIIDIIVFLVTLFIFILARFVLEKDIKTVSQQKRLHDISSKRYIFYQVIFILSIIVVYIASLVFSIDILRKVLILIFSIVAIQICILFVNKKILQFYGEEIEVSWQKYFRKGYEANLYALLANGVGWIIGVYVCIKIFEIDTFVQIWGLWAGILAFMWFTAPVWAIDMIAGIILLQSKNYAIGNVYYIEESKNYIWIKNISLTEVKCIDLRFWHPLIYRPSQFRNLTLKNISQGIQGKSSKILREIDIHISYSTDINDVRQLCYDAYEEMLQFLNSPTETNYFWDDGYVSLEIAQFWDYAVGYKLFYTLTSWFYIFKAERIFHEFLLKHQVKNNIFFATPDLLSIKKN